MSKLSDLVLFRRAGSALAFRERWYTPQERALLLQDALALANAKVTGPRFLFLGVRDGGGKRALIGLTDADVADMQHTMPVLLARSIDPPFQIVVRAMKVKLATIGFLCLRDCTHPPYVLRRSVAGLAAGAGWVRRGTQQFPLAPSPDKNDKDKKLQVG